VPEAELADVEVSDQQLTFAEFLEHVPPNTWRQVVDLRRGSEGSRQLSTPDIRLHCDDDGCGGERFYSYIGSRNGFVGQSLRLFLDYRCKNCGRSSKVFPIFASATTGFAGNVLKLGEFPAFGPYTPPRLVSLIGPDRDVFLKGRRSESQGLGVGAYAYYRRVVENQKDRLLDEIIRVAERVKSGDEVIDTLKAAKQETQFSKAVASAKGVIPETLLIEGHNPLTLLHSALSEGLHAKSDEECLQLATSIRIVLQELAEKASAALKDHAQLTTALSRLMNRT